MRWTVPLLVAVSLAAGCDLGGDDAEPSAQPTDRTTTAEPAPETTAAEPDEGSSLVWVGVEDADELVLVDVEAGKVVERHEVPGPPHNVTVARDGTAAAALYGGDHLVTVGRDRLAAVDLGATPHDVKAVGRLFVVANEAAKRIDIVRGRRHTGSISLRAEPHDLAVAPDGRSLWITLNGTDELAVVNLRERRATRYVSTGQSPHDILFSPGGQLWVTDWQGPVHVFRADGKLRRSVELGEEAHHLAFTPDGREAWITDHGVNKAFVVDTRSLRVVASLAVPGAPHHVAVTADGSLAAVADHDNGTLVVYDVRRRKNVRTIEVGPGPHGVWAVPADARPR
jgi:DNA-binding beta-propeller fold protein YncE